MSYICLFGFWLASDLYSIVTVTGRFLDDWTSETYSYLPFGIGNRVCLGSTISKIEMFMYCACLLSKYELSCPDGDPLPDTTGVPGLTMRPKPFRVKLIER